MAVLPPYTNTYADVDHSLMDADDLVNEFWRVAYFLELWSGSIDAIGQEDNFEVFIEIVEGELAEILPARGLIQRIEVEADVESFEIAIKEHTTGAPFRVYIVVRCRSKATRFTVSAPAGETHLFGLNRSTFMPAQEIGDDFYSAALLCTYGSENGLMVQVMAANVEATEVDYDDVLTAVPL
jgi:hypothetical protein